MNQIGEIDIFVLPAGRELDVLVAEQVMELSLIPHRELAMARIGRRYISSTGPVFTLINGERVTVPPGDGLKQPKGTDDWNARYDFFIAQFLGSKIDDEVAAYRLAPKPYSESIAVAEQVLEKLIAVLHEDSIAIHHVEGQWKVGVVRSYSYDCDHMIVLGEGETLSLAICRAALKAVTE